MRFSIKREVLLKPLQIVSAVVEKRQTLPILSNVLINIDKDLLTMIGTDLEVELVTKTALENAEPGEITLPARKFVDICRSLPEEAQVEVVIDGDKATIRSGRSRFTLSTLPSTEYPSTEQVSGSFRCELSQSVLKELIERTQFCMANQDVRYYLNGLLLEIENGYLRSVATDGHRLAMAQVESEVMPGNTIQAIVPRKGILELARLLKDDDAMCEIILNSNHLRINLEDIVFTSKLIDGRFPEYRRVIPTKTDQDKILIADRDTLKSALMRAAILSNEKYRGIRINVGNNLLHATVHNPEQEEADEEIAVEYGADPLEIGFNVNYLVDAMNAINEDKVEMTLTDANSSCLLRGKGDEMAQYVVMPMRL